MSKHVISDLYHAKETAPALFAKQDWYTLIEQSDGLYNWPFY